MKITRAQLDPFLKRYRTEALVLDIGAGKVSTNHSYTEYFPNRHTVDVDPKRLPDTVADVHQLPFQDGSYDVVLATEVLEHCHTPPRALSEMVRVLKSRGTLILTTRFVYPLHDIPHDYYRFTEYGLRHLLSDMDILELTPETETFSALGALLERVGFQTTLRGGKLTKAVVYSVAKILTKLNWLIMSEYGDIGRRTPTSHIMTTGYYVVARKQ